MTLFCLLLSHQRFCLPISRRPPCPGPSHACVPSSQEHPASNLQPWDTNTQAVREAVRCRWSADRGLRILMSQQWGRIGKTNWRFVFYVHVPVSVCYCYDLSNTHSHSVGSTLAVLYVNRTWLRHQTRISLRPEAEILHHHPCSQYIWSLVKQSCVSWEAGLLRCLVGVMSTQMCRGQAGAPANGKMG